MSFPTTNVTVNLRSIGSVMWNCGCCWPPAAQFADIIEQTLYNGFLSGPALDGRTSST